MSKSKFAGLLDSLGTVEADTAETLAKSAPAGEAVGDKADGDKAADAAADTAADDAAIERAAAEGEGGEDMAKSFSITLEDGTVIEAVDGAAMIKSLVERIEGFETESVSVVERCLGVMQTQGALIKSLSDKVDLLSNSPVGRKAVLTIAEKPAAAVAETLAKSDAPAGLTGDQFLAKALTAQAAGRINGLQVSIAEQSIAAGQQPPADIVRAVLQPDA